MSKTKVKIQFALNEQEIADRPIDTESMWC